MDKESDACVCTFKKTKAELEDIEERLAKKYNISKPYRENILAGVSELEECELVQDWHQCYASYIDWIEDLEEYVKTQDENALDILCLLVDDAKKLEALRINDSGLRAQLEYLSEYLDGPDSVQEALMNSMLAASVICSNGGFCLSPETCGVCHKCQMPQPCPEHSKE